MRYEVSISYATEAMASSHLLGHFQTGAIQEDLCFALWRPSTGANRITALIDEIILPEEGERNLHGNASFDPTYMGRAIDLARKQGAGLAFMHSHPGPGWQSMSAADTVAERDVLAYPAQATGLPLVGLTLGRDGYWSARFWKRTGDEMLRHWCEKIRVTGPRTFRAFSNDALSPPPPRREVLRRTIDTWGKASQDTVARLSVGIVGLGSVGCLVAESMARIGVSRLTLIDHDRVEAHNLDRLLYGTVDNVGQLKVVVAAEALRAHGTADSPHVTALPLSIRDEEAYRAALDCDLIFSCVDRPLPRDILNYIAVAHQIPVIDGGVAVDTDLAMDKLFAAHWRAHVVTPESRCLRCMGQYNSSMVTMELDGSLDDPTYIRDLPPEYAKVNQNVFPFAQSVAAMEVNLMLRLIVAEPWWPAVQQQEHQFLSGETTVAADTCQPYCSFLARRSKGDAEVPFYLNPASPQPSRPARVGMLARLFRSLGKMVGRIL